LEIRVIRGRRTDFLWIAKCVEFGSTELRLQGGFLDHSDELQIGFHCLQSDSRVVCLRVRRIISIGVVGISVRRAVVRIRVRKMIVVRIRVARRVIVGTRTRRRVVRREVFLVV